MPHVRFKRGPGGSLVEPHRSRPLPRIQTEEDARRIPRRRRSMGMRRLMPRIEAPERPVPMPLVRSTREHEQIEKVRKKAIEKVLRERGFDPSAPRAESEADVRREPPPLKPRPEPRTPSRKAIFDPKEPIRVETEADVRRRTGRLPPTKKKTRGLFDYLND